MTREIPTIHATPYSLWCNSIAGCRQMQRLTLNEAKCVGCGQCALHCDFEALTVCYGLCKVDLEKCTGCETCIDYCPTESLCMEWHNGG